MAIDDYKPLDFYSSRSSNTKDGFAKFSHDNQHYFTYNKDGKVYFISQSYTSTDGRDNGINSVKKNMNNEARYSKAKTKSGKHYFSLKAGNNQEIARSRYFESSGAMAAAMTGLLTGKWASSKASNNTGKTKKVDTSTAGKTVAGAAAMAGGAAASTKKTVKNTGKAVAAGSREVVESTSSGINWLWWLLPLLLLALLLYFFRGCFGCNGDGIVAGAKDKMEQTTSAVGDAANKVAEGAKDAANSVVDGAKDATNAVVDGAKDMTDNAAEAARKAKAEADKMAAEAKRKAEQAKREAEEYARRQSQYDRGNKSAGY